MLLSKHVLPCLRRIPPHLRVQRRLKWSPSGSTSHSEVRPVLAVRRETINLWERRAPLAPTHVKKLVQDGFEVIVQPSNRRAYTAQQYLTAGAKVQEDISEASVIIGVKKPPLDYESLIPNKTYAFFSHTIKAQQDNMTLLDAILERNIRLIDYERMLDEKGQRMVAFGQYAGIAGMINILHGIGLRFLALGHHTPFMHIGLAHNYRSVEQARQAVRDAGYEIALGNMPRSIGPLTFVFTGSGNVSSGAQDIFNNLPCEFVGSDHLQDVAIKGDISKVYGCVVSRNDHYQRRDGGGFDPEEFDAHPEKYISTFSQKIAPYASVIINGIYWAVHSPRLLTIPDAKKLLRLENKMPWTETSPGCPMLPHRLIAVCDISADPGGSIEFMKECTTIDKPFGLYDAEENMSNEKFFGSGVLICSIDNMPAQIPLEATDFFGSLLLPHVYQMLKSDAAKPFEKFDCSPVVKNAVIASNGALTPSYQYIERLREKRRAEKVMPASGVHRRQVLVLGAGYVVPPLIEYLCRDKSCNLTIVSDRKADLAIVDKFQDVTPVHADVIRDTERLDQLIRSHELVISMVPWKFHADVLRRCILQKKNMLTASYCTPQLQEFAEEIEQAGITAMMEVGLDPGIDHILAKECIDAVNQGGGRVLSYKSYTGGLPAPEFSQNPLRYKFSWSPESALLTAINPAKYIEKGKIVEIRGGGELMLNAKEMPQLPGFNLEGYPNRDSTRYVSLYGLESAHTVIRGTLRYKGYTDAMWSLIQLGLVSSEHHPLLHPDGPELTWKEFMCSLMGMRQDVFTGTLKDAVYNRLARDRQKFACIEDLGLFSDGIMEKLTTPLATLSNYLAKPLAFGPDERDVIIMIHDVGIEWPDHRIEKKSIQMVVYGQPNGGYLAMSKTVGVPTAIAAKMILNEEIQQKGIVLPLSSDIYRPMLKRMKQEGIEAHETSVFIEQ